LGGVFPKNHITIFIRTVIVDDPFFHKNGLSAPTGAVFYNLKEPIFHVKPLFFDEPFFIKTKRFLQIENLVLNIFGSSTI